MKIGFERLLSSRILRAGKPSNQSCRVAAGCKRSNKYSQPLRRYLAMKKLTPQHYSTLFNIPFRLTLTAYWPYWLCGRSGVSVKPSNHPSAWVPSVLLISNVGVISGWSGPPSQHLPDEGVSLFVPELLHWGLNQSAKHCKTALVWEVWSSWLGPRFIKIPLYQCFEKQRSPSNWKFVTDWFV